MFTQGGNQRVHDSCKLMDKDLFYWDPDCRTWSEDALQQLPYSLYQRSSLSTGLGTTCEDPEKGFLHWMRMKVEQIDQRTMNLRVKIRRLGGQAGSVDELNRTCVTEKSLVGTVANGTIKKGVTPLFSSSMSPGLLVYFSRKAGRLCSYVQSTDL